MKRLNGARETERIRFGRELFGGSTEGKGKKGNRFDRASRKIDSTDIKGKHRWEN